jgi:sodium/hydrogen antiporter
MMITFSVYLVVGILVILSAWVPLFVGRLPLSLPMIAVAIGVVLSLFTPVSDYYGEHAPLALHLTEFALLVSIFGAGLKLDRRFSLRGWDSTWRLLGLAMPLSIGIAAGVGSLLLGLPVGPAVLLGAILAPTDPVLASGFGAGPPGHGEEGETKFALSSEAGLNDGLAFPFVLLGLALAGAGTKAGFLHWLLVDLVWNVAGAVAVGVGLGWLLSSINRLLREPMRLSSSNSGLVAVGLAFLAYGLASAIGANGFVAVFCEAVAIRNFTRRHEYSQRLNHVAEQFERLSMVGVLVMLGVSLVRGQLHAVGPAEIGYAVIILLLVRPVAVLFGFLGSAKDRWVRAALGFFGIRGIASLYYIIYVSPQLASGPSRQLTAVVSLVVLISVVLYGASAGEAGRFLIRDIERPGAKGVERQAEEEESAHARVETHEAEPS